MSERLIRLTVEDVAAFAAASGDRNPLYTDAVFARRTPFGRPIVPGALTVFAALAAVPGDRLRATGQLTARFSRPMLAGVTYRVAVREKDDGVLSVVAYEGDLSALAVELTPGPALAGAPAPAARAVPATPDTPEFPARGHEISGEYGVPAPAELRALADRLGGTEVPDPLLGALAWASWFAGMRIPGRDALFSGLRIRTTEAAEPGYRATVKSADARTGTIVVTAACPGLECELRAFRRSALPAPTWDSATRVLPAGDRLAGSNVLVVGGSRGIGAAIVSVLAAQGATVWATQRAPGAVEELRREFGEDRIRPLELDATDADQVTAAFTALGDVELDGVVLCAGPPVLLSSLHPDNVGAIREFVDTSLTMALVPLTAALERLAPGGWLAMLSSGAVEDAPEQRPQYLIAKSAIEALGRYSALRHGLRVLLARAPKMWTEMNNGPLGRMGTVPTEQVASAIVGWVLNRTEVEPVTVLSPTDLASWTFTERVPAAAP
ncbi:SDR family oxidoreductase [Amycolatopsis anabasis]|uniref:SDR family oxidoreductase n=1 Tax=Amycolatopsis anabasis TaxID=1840409 RepID=UPI00131A88C3|nr:SDR family oxidoreductase [Amycolatopsis anabasis]